MMPSDTSPATNVTESSTETRMGTETRSESTSGTLQTPAPRVLTGGCMCKSIRYKIARDECQERMNMSMSRSLFPVSLYDLYIGTFCCPAICVYFVVLVVL